MKWLDEKNLKRILEIDYGEFEIMLKGLGFIYE